MKNIVVDVNSRQELGKNVSQYQTASSARKNRF